MIVGYARTSTADQIAGFDAQIQELKAAGCKKMFQEQVSSVGKRAQLEAALEYVREGDVLVVTKLDRLARSMPDLMTMIQALDRKSVGLHVLNLGMDTHTPTGKLMLTVLGGCGAVRAGNDAGAPARGGRARQSGGQVQGAQAHCTRAARRGAATGWAEADQGQHRPKTRSGRGQRLPDSGRGQKGENLESINNAVSHFDRTDGTFGSYVVTGPTYANEGSAVSRP